MNRTTVAVGGFALVLGLVVGAAGAKLAEDDSSSLTPSAKKATSTVAIERRNLEVTEELTGQLATSSQQDLTTIGQGVVTQAATLGTTLQRGNVIARVDDQPTVYLFGFQPVWRSFQPGMSDGADIRQLEENLVALGFDPDNMTVDDTYSAATAAAITAWETSLKLQSPDGVVPAGQVIFGAGPTQVSDSTAAGTRVTPGSTLATVRPVGGQGLQLTFTVTEEADRYQAGKPVTIVSTDAAKHPATITGIARAASTSGGGGFGGGGGGAASFTVTATPNDGSGLVPGPVEVEVPTQLADNALAVPSRALVAVLEGGQAVQLADGNRLVRVEVGVFADGWVQVTGDQIQQGEKVVVPT